jgi:hypothetical protein
MPEGMGRIIAGLGFSGTTKAFDAHGRLIPVPSYQKFELGTYVEYGLKDWLTILASPSLDLTRQAGQALGVPGIDESEIGARVQLYRTNEHVVSIEGGFLSRGTAFNEAGARESRATAFDLRLLAAQNFNLAYMPAFVDLQGGRRFYTENQPGEWHIDVTLGLRPFPALLLLVQNFNVIQIGTTPVWPRQTYHKLQLSFAYELSPQWSVQMGGFRTIMGMNAGREIGPFIGFWYRF